jgi:hypothetical protein
MGRARPDVEPVEMRRCTADRWKQEPTEAIMRNWHGSAAVGILAINGEEDVNQHISSYLQERPSAKCKMENAT